MEAKKKLLQPLPSPAAATLLCKMEPGLISYGRECWRLLLMGFPWCCGP